MSVLVLILKIIGTLLLFFLILTALIFLHPIYYCIEGEKEDELSARGYFWWIFQILRLDFEVLSGEAQIRFRLFGWQINLNEKNMETKETADDQTQETGSDIGEPSKEEHSKDQGKETFPKESFSKEQEKESMPEDTKRLDMDFNKEEPSTVKKPQKRVKQKKAKQKQPKKSKPNLKDKWNRFRKEIKEEGNHKAVSLLWKEFWRILSHLKPSHTETDISFSAGDPAVTGTLVGALSLLPFLYRGDTQINPDFLSEEAYVKGRIKLKGHMALSQFACSLFRLIFDKNIRQLYEKIRK